MGGGSGELEAKTYFFRGIGELESKTCCFLWGEQQPRDKRHTVFQMENSEFESKLPVFWGGDGELDTKNLLFLGEYNNLEI